MTRKTEKLLDIRFAFAFASITLGLCGCFPHSESSCVLMEWSNRINFGKEHLESSYLEITQLGDKGFQNKRTWKDVIAQEATMELLTLLEGEQPVELESICCPTCSPQADDNTDITNDYNGVYSVEIHAGGGYSTISFSAPNIVVIYDYAERWRTDRKWMINKETTNEAFKIAYNILLDQGYIDE